jgi:hypothetical protein
MCSVGDVEAISLFIASSQGCPNLHWKPCPLTEERKSAVKPEKSLNESGTQELKKFWKFLELHVLPW